MAAAPQCREELTLPRKSPKSLRERSAVASKPDGRLRLENYAPGLLPCGEGAGYARI